MDYVEYILEDGTVIKEPCRRSNGSFRAHFASREDAERFAADSKNWPSYQNDIAHKCQKCLYWHLSKAHWLCPEWETVSGEDSRIN